MSAADATSKEQLMRVLSQVHAQKNQLVEENTQLKSALANANAKQSEAFAREREKLEGEFELMLSQQTEMAREQGEQLELLLNEMKTALENEEQRAQTYKLEAEASAKRLVELEQQPPDQLGLVLELDQLKHALLASQNELATRNHALAKVETELNEVKLAHEAQIQSLQVQLAVAVDESAPQQYDKANDATITEMKAAYEAQIKSLQDQLVAATVEEEALQNGEAKEAAITEMKAAYEAQIQLLQDQLATAVDQKAQHSYEEIAELKAAHEAQMQSLKDQFATAMEEKALHNIEEKDAEIAELKQQLDEVFDQKNMEIADVREELENELVAVRKEFANNEQKWKEKLDLVEIAHEQRIAELKQDHSAVQRAKLYEIEDLKEMLSIAQNETSMLQQELNRMVATKDGEIEALKQQISTTTTTTTNAAVGARDVVDSSREIDDLRQQLSKPQQEIAKQDDGEVECLRQQVAALEAMKLDFSQSLNSLELQTEQFEKRIREERHRVSDERAKNQLLQEELNNANSRFESMIRGEAGPWVSHGENDDMPIPTHLTLDSPVIQTILLAWTRDKDNLNFFNAWCRQVLTKKDLASVQPGVELNKCTTQVKDGILSMLVPMLRARRGITVSVFTRERVQVNYDVRLRVNLPPAPSIN